MKFGEKLGELMEVYPNSEELRRMEGELLGCMTTREKLRYAKGFCKATGRNRLLEILGLV